MLSLLKYIPCKMWEFRDEGMCIRRTLGDSSGNFHFACNWARSCYFSISVQKCSFKDNGSSILGKVVLPLKRGAYFLKAGFRASSPSFFMDRPKIAPRGPRIDFEWILMDLGSIWDPFWVDLSLILPGFDHNMDSPTSQTSLTYKPLAYMITTHESTCSIWSQS